MTLQPWARCDSAAEGEPCTLIALRETNGQFGLYYHGGVKSSAIFPPPVYDQLIAALTRLTSSYRSAVRLIH